MTLRRSKELTWAVALAAALTLASANPSSADDRLTEWHGDVFRAAAPGLAPQCTSGDDYMDHGLPSSSLGRMNQTYAKLQASLSDHCGQGIRETDHRLRHLGAIYSAPFKGAAGNLCIRGGYQFNIGTVWSLDYRTDENAWTKFCGSQGHWVTQDLERGSISPDNRWWYVGTINGATGHQYPS